jgi:membrane protein required for colicin V production
MNPIDIVIIVLLIAGFVWGFSKGFIYMIFSLIAILAGVFTAGKIAPLILPHLFAAKYYQIGYIVLFIIIFTIIYFIIKKLTYLVEDMVEFLELEWLDSLLGGVIGFFQLFIIAGIILSLAYSTGIIKIIPYSNEIKFAGFMMDISQKIIGFIAGNVNKFKV